MVDDGGFLAALAGGELAADRGRVAVVQGGLDQQPTGVRGAGLVILPSRRVWPELCSDKTSPTYLAIASG